MARDGHAVGIRHALVSQTDSQHRDSPCKALDHFAGDPRFFWSAWAGGDDQVRGTLPRIELIGLVRGDLVMAHDNQVLVRFEGSVDLTQSLDKVPCEGVVVVDQEYHER